MAIIANDGEAIPDQTRDRFRGFLHHRRESGGTGMGLPIVQSLAAPMAARSGFCARRRAWR